MASYPYQPLASPTNIRIIALEPSFNKDSPLHCSIEEIPINNLDETYEAISYTWGAPIFSHSIYASKKSVLRITPNLHAALTRFRSPHYVRRLWADSICINQGDDEEKAVQIQLMRQVFRNASRVLAWLGDSQNGEEAVKLLCRKTKGDDSSVENMASGEIEKQAMQIRQLFEMPWFSRRWIIQEIVLNPDVIIFCNRAEISLVRLFQALNILSRTSLLSQVKSHILKSLMAIYELWKNWSMGDKKAAQHELISLLPVFHHFGCVDDRDKIYALSALANNIPVPEDTSIYTDGVPNFINYSASVEEVYTAFAARLLPSCPLAVFQTAVMHSQKEENRTLPSWVPDWRQPPRDSILFSPPDMFKGYGVYTGYRMCVSNISHRMILQVSKATVETITGVKYYDPQIFDVDAVKSWLSQFVKSIAYEFEPSGKKIIRRLFEVAAIADKSRDKQLTFYNPKNPFNMSPRYYKSLHRILIGRSVFLEGRGDDSTRLFSVGVGTPTVQKGDICCHLSGYGCLILRPIPESSDARSNPACRLVGVGLSDRAPHPFSPNRLEFDIV